MSGPPRQLEDDISALGISLAAELKPRQELLVLPEHWPAVEFLRSMSGSCWKYAPMGGAVGFDYPQIESLMRLLEVNRKDRKELFENLQWIERGALDELNRKAKK